MLSEREKETQRHIAQETRILKLERKVNTLLKRNSFVVPITTLAPEPYELLKPIQAVVKSSDDEFEAGFYDANIHAGGCNETEAIDNLKDLLVSRFDYLSEQKEAALAKPLQAQIKVLREFIRRKE